MTAFVLSLIRTIVPIVVGSVLGWLAVIGLEIDSEGQQGLAIFIAGTLTASYYTAVRWIGQRFPGVEILLGSRQTPDGYSKVTHTEAPEFEAPWMTVNKPEDTSVSDDEVPPGYTS